MKYQKINTIFKRDMEKPGNPIIEGDFACPEFYYLKNNIWEWSEKVNGTNIRVILNKDDIEFRGKTDNAQLSAKLIKRLHQVFYTHHERIKDVLGLMEDDAAKVIIYGEGYGAGIAKGGGNYSQEQDFVIFDIRIGNWWLKWEDVSDVSGHIDICAVPIIGRGTLSELVEFVKPGFQSQWGNFQAEGIVARPSVQLFDRKGERIITKLKCKDFTNEG